MNFVIIVARTPLFTLDVLIDPTLTLCSREMSDAQIIYVCEALGIQHVNSSNYHVTRPTKPAHGCFNYSLNDIKVLSGKLSTEVSG